MAKPKAAREASSQPRERLSKEARTLQSIGKVVEMLEWKSMDALLTEDAMYDMLEDIVQAESTARISSDWLKVTLTDLLAEVQAGFKRWLSRPSPYRGGYHIGRPNPGELLSYTQYRSSAPVAHDSLAELQMRNDVANIKKMSSRHLMYKMMIVCAILRLVSVNLIEDTDGASGRDIKKMKAAAREGDRVLQGLVMGKPNLVARIMLVQLP